MKLQDRFKSTQKRKRTISVYLDENLLATLDANARAWDMTRNEVIIRILKQYFHAGVKDQQ